MRASFILGRSVFHHYPSKARGRRIEGCCVEGRRLREECVCGRGGMEEREGKGKFCTYPCCVEGIRMDGWMMVTGRIAGYIRMRLCLAGVFCFRFPNVGSVVDSDLDSDSDFWNIHVL